MSQQVSTTIAVMGIDIGKNSFHVVGLDQQALAKQLRTAVSVGQKIP
jgi:Tfp pilus assembly PilM family ATPase